MGRHHQINPAEDFVERILNKFKNDGRIKGFLRNHQSDRLDAEGIDFLIFMKNGWALPLQVKSGNARDHREEKLREHLHKHPLVLYLICVPTYLLESNLERAEKITEKELENILF